MQQLRIRRRVAGAAIAVVGACLLVACHSTPAERSVQVELNCEWAGISLPWPVPDVPGSVTVTAKSPVWATEGSRVPVLEDLTLTDVDLPMEGTIFTLVDVQGGTWHGPTADGYPLVDPEVRSSVTITEPVGGQATIAVHQIVVADVVVERPRAYRCTPTATSGPLADIAVRAA